METHTHTENKKVQKQMTNLFGSPTKQGFKYTQTKGYFSERMHTTRRGYSCP